MLRIQAILHRIRDPVFKISDPVFKNSDPVFKITDPVFNIPDPAWIWPKIDFFCNFCSSQSWYKIFTRRSYHRRIEYYRITLFQQKKSHLRNFRYDFLIILVDVLFFKDPIFFFWIWIWVIEKSRILWILIRNTAFNVIKLSGVHN